MTPLTIYTLKKSGNFM